MEGRRVNHSAPKRNPLYVMFLCLVAAVFVLLIVVIVLGAKLGAAQKAAKGAETQIEELQEQVKKLEEEKKAAEDAANGPDEKLPGGDTPAVDPNETKEPDTSVSDSKRKVGWLDLTGHSEVTVLPKKVFNEYASYYTTAGVNLRSGPSTSSSTGARRSRLRRRRATGPSFPSAASSAGSARIIFPPSRRSR